MGSFVYVVKDDGTVTVRKIVTGAADATRTVVSEGLAVGDKVVIDGADRLREGSKVKLASAKADAGPARTGLPADNGRALGRATARASISTAIGTARATLRPMRQRPRARRRPPPRRAGRQAGRHTDGRAIAEREAEAMKASVRSTLAGGRP